MGSFSWLFCYIPYITKLCIPIWRLFAISGLSTTAQSILSHLVPHNLTKQSKLTTSKQPKQSQYPPKTFPPSQPLPKAHPAPNPPCARDPPTLQQLSYISQPALLPRSCIDTIYLLYPNKLFPLPLLQARKTPPPLYPTPPHPPAFFPTPETISPPPCAPAFPPPPVTSVKPPPRDQTTTFKYNHPIPTTLPHTPPSRSAPATLKNAALDG